MAELPRDPGVLAHILADLAMVFTQPEDWPLPCQGFPPELQVQQLSKTSAANGDHVFLFHVSSQAVLSHAAGG